MKYGLTEKQINEIRDILASYQEVEQAILFGSRAIDSFKEASDVDIAIIGDKCDLLLSAKIKDHLEDETYLPFFFDIIAYNTIKSPELKNHIQTKGKIIFQRKEEWREVKLGDIIDLNYGKSLVANKRNKGDIPVYSSAGITGYHNEPLVNSKGIIVGRKGTIGTVYKSEYPFYCIDTAYYILPDDDKYNFNFLYYLLQTLGFKDLNSDSAVPGLNRNTAYDQSFMLPPLPEQKAIAEVLSSLDDKIDLLHRQNKTLEEMAETLFRQWFIEERDESWEERELGSFFPVITGKKNANYSTDNGAYPFFTCSQDTLFAPDYSFNSKAILLAGNGDFNLKRYSGKFEAYQRTYVLIPYEEKYHNFLYVLMKYYLSDITGGHRGSVIQFITKGMINDFKIKIQTDKLEKKLKYFDRIYYKVDYNKNQQETLNSIRDTLLPKLMSGKVSIKNAITGV